ncbi:hypothetical protein ZOSMA_94G00430 [Zostera marina]|uniref:peptidylprolyl isomerase n=2 Tax=Zostera marina TaxID=29655 RepID=A0A0K9NKA2_ZOSMR|nr:hypothetical protein ZOSMA_94G00430 [Zostera marina]
MIFFSDARDVVSDIPPNTTLTIDLELVSLMHVVDVSGDLMVLKKIMKKGEEGSSRPEDGLSVWIKSTGKLEDGTIFDRFGFDVDGGFQFILGEEQVITGLDIAAATMAKGEVSLLTIKPQYGYGENEFRGNLATVPSHSTLIFEIEMIDFIKGKEPWTMNLQERLQAIEALKECGNSLFKTQKYERALKKYTKALYYMDEKPIEDAEARKMSTLKVSCLLNSAACNLKLNDFRVAINYCTSVLEIEFHNAKALYRRAQAFIETSDLDLAATDIRRLIETDPQNREAILLQKKLKQLEAEKNKKDSKFCANMFAETKKYTNQEPKKMEDGISNMKITSHNPPQFEEHTASSVEAMVVSPTSLQSGADNV